MARLPAVCTLVIGFTLVGGGAARAQSADPAGPAVEPVAPLRVALLADPEETPPPETKAPAEGAPAGAAGAGVAGAVEEEGAVRPRDLSYGVAARLRWVSVPGWLLGLFTRRNVPLSSYATALEMFRRRGDFDFVLSVGYQNMSPSDGNWLAKGEQAHPAATDTDYVQFRGLGLIGIDASFIWHQRFNDWVGMHYGAGLGVGFVLGHLLRTSNGSGCTEDNAGNVIACHPIGVNCSTGVCSEADLQRTSMVPNPAMVDSAVSPARFQDSNVPAAVPIVNIVVGLDFHVPTLRGWEAKIEGGFYDAFFLGGGVGYTF
jgi:hypothetical protein